MDKAPVILTILLGVVLVRGGAEAPEGQPSLKTTFEPTACDDDGDVDDGDDDDDDDDSSVGCIMFIRCCHCPLKSAHERSFSSRR